MWVLLWWFRFPKYVYAMLMISWLVRVDAEQAKCRKIKWACVYFNWTPPPHIRSTIYFVCLACPLTRCRLINKCYSNWQFEISHYNCTHSTFITSIRCSIAISRCFHFSEVKNVSRMICRPIAGDNSDGARHCLIFDFNESIAIRTFNCFILAVK